MKKYPPITFLIGYPYIINNERSQASKDEKN
jgi:hypothetical protein